ncbi:MAG TPA: MFS transporter [Propionicimonas sp.]|uniref:MFS transporter n=1 Tax=Propionicimonas sp. TaxID=1955623 RepID=UPI002F3E98E6
MTTEELPALLRRLVLPVYLPTALYATGAAAIVPVVPLIGLDLGLNVPQVALLGTVAGLLTVIGPLPMGQLVARIGERAALVVGGLVSIVAIVGCLFAAWSDGTAAHPMWAPALFCASILVMNVGDITWDLGRQTYIADEIPVHLRARAMSLFGGTMRVGRIIGPLLGAVMITLAGPAAAFLVHLVAAIAGLVMIVIFIPPRLAPAPGDEAGESIEPPARGTVLRPLLLVGVAVVVLTTARTNRDLLLPLLGNEFGHPEAVISLVFAGAAVVELAFILPAGTLMDRFGRAAVLVPCLALMGVGYLLAPIAATVPGFIAISLIFAVGNGLGAGINKTLSADLTPSRNRAGWLGLWNSFTNAGALIGPALVAVAGAATVVTASFATGWLSLAGAGWAAWWMPRFLPGRARISRRSGPPSASA